VHNGIIENFAALRHELETAGVEFASDTDSEVAVHLIAHAYAAGPTAGDFVESALAVVRRLEGHFTVVFAHADNPGTIVAARRSTPLVVGIGDGEMFIGSDVAAFIEYTREAIELGQDQAVVITADGCRIMDFDGRDASAQARPFHIDWDLSAAEKGGYEFFMLKEIAEQPAAVSDTLLGHFVDGRIGLFILITLGVTLAVRLVLPVTAGMLTAVVILLPVAAAQGIHPWICVFCAAMFSDISFFRHQGTNGIMQIRAAGLFEETDERSFLRYNMVMNAARVAVVFASIPWWGRLGLL
jgi:hypothetical protein